MYRGERIQGEFAAIDKDCQPVPLTGFSVSAYLSTDPDGGSDNADDVDLGPTINASGNVVIDFDTYALQANTYYYSVLAEQPGSNPPIRYQWDRETVQILEPVTKPTATP